MNIKKLDKTTVQLDFGDDDVFNIRINNKTMLNALDTVLDDLKSIQESLESYYKDIVDCIENSEDFLDLDTTIELSKRLVQKKFDEKNLSDWSQKDKKTSKSIFFEPNEVIEVLEIIAAIKILSIFIHSEYQQLFRKLIIKLSKYYSKTSQKLFSVVKARTFRWTPEELQLVKTIITNDFISLYNFDFIFMSVLPNYKWDKNPITFIVSVASENSSYLLLTYRSQQQTFSDIDVSTNILDTVSYEIVLQTIENRVSNEINILSTMFPTPITTEFAMPILSVNLDIPVSYLLQKSIDKLLAYQYFTYLLAKNSPKLSKILHKSLRLLQLASFKPTQIRTSPHPVVLEVFKQDITYYKLHNKQPLIDVAIKLSSVIDSELVYITSGNPFEGDKEVYVKNAISILGLIVSDKVELLKDVDTLKKLVKNLEFSYNKVV